MTAGRGAIAVVAGLCIAALAAAPVERSAPPPGPQPAVPSGHPAAGATERRARAAVAALPVRFEPNVGQVGGPVRFRARTAGSSLFLTGTEAVLALPRLPVATAPGRADAPPAVADVVRMRLAGAAPSPLVAGTGRLPGLSNYFLGNDARRWRTGVPGYRGVRYRGVYPGIDLHYHGGEGGLEYDFEVAAGADPSAIAMEFAGGGTPSVDRDGALVLHTGAGPLRQQAPVLYQGAGPDRRRVAGGFRVEGDRVGFAVGTYDRSRPLVIDPVIAYSSYLGGATRPSYATDDTQPVGVAVGTASPPDGAAYVSGVTYDTDFPVAPTSGPSRAVQTTIAGMSDRFVTKVDTTRTGAASLVWSTYLGGSRLEGFGAGTEPLGGVAVDGSGNVYVTGSTLSRDFPTGGLVAPLRATCGTDGACNGTDNAYTDGASTAGSTAYTSTQAGFYTEDIGLPISGANIPAGATIANIQRVDPSTLGAVLSVPATATGSGLAFTVGKRDPYPDAFVTKLNPSGSALLYSTYLGGADADQARAVALGPTPGTVFVAGVTRSRDFPTNGTAASLRPRCGTDGGGTCNAQDSTSGDGASTINSTTYTSASGAFRSTDVGRAVTGANIAPGTTIAGVVNRATITLSAPASASGTGLSYTVVARTPQTDAFLAEIDTTRTGLVSLAYATYLGGSGADEARAVAVDSAGVAYLGGTTSSTDLPTATAYQSSMAAAGNDAFVAKVDPAGGTGGLRYGTYLGGAGSDVGAGIAVDRSSPPNGNAYLAGSTGSSNFPVKAPAPGTPFQAANQGGDDAFVAKLATASAGAASLVYATYLGGSGTDAATAVALDAQSPPNAVVAGSTSSGDFPTLGTLQVFSGQSDAFVASVNSAGSALGYSTWLGGNSDDSASAVAVDTANQPYVVGQAGPFFPVVGGFQAPNPGRLAGFVARLDPTRNPPLVSQVSPRGGPYGGGTPVVVTGSGFGGVSAVNFGSTAVTSGISVDTSQTHITVASPPCAGPCDTLAASTVNVTVTASGSTSTPSAAARFSYGDGVFAPTACPADLCTAIAAYDATTLASGRVLVVYLSRAGGGSVAAAVFDPLSSTWAPAPAPCPGTTYCIDATSSATLLRSGKVLVAGGIQRATGLVFDPGANAGAGAWAATANSMATARGSHSATLLASGKVLLAGGCTGDCKEGGAGAVSLNTAELYDPATNAFAATGPMASDRNDHRAVLLGGPACAGASPPPYCNKVLVVGGVTLNAVTAAAELYDPVLGVWAPTAPMAAPRVGSQATVLAGPACVGPASPPAYCGKVLVAGGGSANWSSPQASAELYDPAAATWAATGAMSTPRSEATGGLLGGGMVLTVGGGVEPDSAERYDPAAGTWGSAGSGKGGVAAALPAGPASVCGMACGRVLVVAAANLPNANAVQLYTPRPVVTGVSPAADCAAGGATVAVTGSGLASVTAASVGATAAPRIVPDPANPDTRLYVTLPAGTAGAGLHLSVTGPGGVSRSTAADVVSYNATATGPPCAPLAVGAAAKNGAAVVSWTPPNGGGGAPTGYTVSANPPTTSFNDGVATAGSTTYTSASAGFVAGDVGHAISGAYIPAGTTIAAVVNPTTITLSAGKAATGSATGLSFTIPERGYAAPATVVVTGGSATSATVAGLTNSLSLPTARGYTFTVAATNASGSGPGATTSVTYAQVTAGEFVPLTPARLLDTRPAPDNAGTCTPSPCATLGAGGIVSAQMAGQAPQGGGPAPVPAAGASAVVLNLTAVNATAPGGGSFLTVWPSDGTQPNSSNLNYAAGPSIANLVTVKLGADGRVKLFNNTGSVDVIADVVGYYVDATAAAASRFNPTDPARLLDTRSGAGNFGTCTPGPCATIGAGATITVQVAGQGSQGGGPAPVPAGAAAVILNLTVANATAGGGGSFLTAWPSDAPQPGTSNVNFSQGRYVSNLVAVKLAPDGTVKLFNNAGSVDVIADVAGWYAPAGSITGDRFTATAPGRIYDTRSAPDNTGTCTPSPCGPIGAGASASAKVAGQAAQGGAVPVPGSGASAVVANITVVQPSGTGGASYLTAWPDGATQPLASNLVYVDGQIVPILATVKLGTNGRIRLYNNTGTANFVADVYGWFNDGTS